MSGPTQFQTADPLELIDSLNASNRVAQSESNAARIPNSRELEQQSSDAIAALLNPPAMFADTNRYAAETGAGRGIGGSSAADSTGVRMTDNERLRRISLGQQFLSAADARNPGAAIVNPLQVIALQEQFSNDQEARRQPAPNISGVSYGGGSGGGVRQGTGMAGSPIRGVPSDYYANDSTHGTGWASYGSSPSFGIDSGGDSGGFLPLYPGGPTPGGGIDAVLRDLGLSGPDYNPGQGYGSGQYGQEEYAGSGDAEYQDPGDFGFYD